jgi:TIR domain/Bacterial sugar transferase
VKTPSVFVSYCREDRQWKDRVVNQLGVLEAQGLLDVWEDGKIGAGQDWMENIEQALDRASVGVLLISASYLVSDFINRVEVNRLLARRNGDGLMLVPILVKPCRWESVDWLHGLQVRPPGARPLSTMRKAHADAALKQVATEVQERLRRLSPASEDAPHQVSGPLGGSAPMTTVNSGTTFVELIINEDFRNFGLDEQQNFVAALTKLLHFADVRVVQKRRGSVKLKLQLTHDEAERLFVATLNGELDKLGVAYATIFDSNTDSASQNAGRIQADHSLRWLENPRLRKWRYLRIRTVLDRILALNLLVLTAPVTLIAILLIRLTSRGNPIYTQVRMGRNGRTFTIYKLRTMYNDGRRPAIGGLHLSANSSGPQKLTSCPNSGTSCEATCA